MAEEGYLDLLDKRRIILTESDMMFINTNPHGLTKEGAQIELNEWLTTSKNRYMQARYLAMIKKCRNWAKSGKLEDGRIILSRKPITSEEGEIIDLNGEPAWVEWVDVNKKRIPKKKWQTLPEEKRFTI